MADFDLVADIRANFQNIKKSAKREKLEFPVEGQSTGGTAGGTGSTGATGKGGLGGMVRLLGIIAVAVGVVSAMLEPLQPLMDMVSGIFKILGMFLLPVMMALMPLLAALMKVFSSVLQWWLESDMAEQLKPLIDNLISNLSKTIENALPEWLPGVNRGGGQGDGTNLPQTDGNLFAMTGGSPLALPGWLNPAVMGSRLAGFIHDTTGFGQDPRQAIIKVEGITDDSTINKIRFMSQAQQEENLG